MSAILAPCPMLQFFDNNGNPLSGGKLFTYANNTTTKTATFTDASGLVQNSNPIILNTRGEPVSGGIWLTPGTTYTFVLSPSTDGDPPTNSIWTVNDLIGISTTNPVFASVAQALAGTSTTLFMNPLDTANAVQQGFNFAADTGAASALSGTFAPAVAARVSGERLFMRAANPSTGALATVNVGLGIDVFKKATPVGLKPIMAGEIVLGQIYPFVWSTTDNLWQTGYGSLPAPTWSLPLAKTAGYTVLPADRNRIIRFSGLAADATIALPPAANSEGFEVTFVNDDTADAVPFGIIVDPNGAETLDGFATRKGYVGTRVTVACDGSAWFTKAGRWRYFSGNQTLTLSGLLTLPHGLGVRPKNTWVEFKNLTAESNYSIGDIVSFGIQIDQSGATNRGLSIVTDATNIVSRQGSGGWQIVNKTSGAIVGVTNANWAIRFWAEE